ncbi:unannotated protein [freshwater metagenome]|uniref:Unannotated protein n=1 Tax=freshwater metagenome TaxID=449393 RepID=A0A6J7DL34_9ZZZZ
MTIPTGLPFSTTTTAPCARFVIKVIASETVSCGARVTGVSKIGCLDLTHETTSATTSTGISCGITTIPPRRAIVSAIRRPAIAVIFATTIGMVVPVPSLVVRSTSSLLVNAERDGTIKTSS